MSNSKHTKLSVEQIVSDIVCTTDDTYDVFLQLTENRSIEIKDRVLQKLNQHFLFLEEKYIDPIIRVEDSIDFRYSEEDFSIADKKILKSNHVLRHDDVQYEAHKIWLKRKQKELNSLLSKDKSISNVKLQQSYLTYKLNDATREDVDSLYNGLIKTQILKKEDNNYKQFIDSFSKSIIEYQPRIKFHPSKQVLCFLIFTLMDLEQLDEDIDYNAINLKSVIFVDKNGKEFSELKSDFKKYRSYSIENFKSKKKVKQLSILLTDIFG